MYIVYYKLKLGGDFMFLFELFTSKRGNIRSSLAGISLFKLNLQKTYSMIK